MNQNQYILFSDATKMVDVILKDYRILNLLPRFDIRLGFGEKSISEVCQKYNINEHFFLMVCNIHSFDDYLPKEQELVEIDIDCMLQYLKRSHNYYINHRMLSIEEKLSKMEDCCQAHHHKIIQDFFKEYKQEVFRHFAYEEEDVFPNIKGLIKGDEVDFHIDQYEEHHDNIDDKLSDLKNIIIKYLPESCYSDERNNILFDIFLFEEDLTKHTRIENKVLIPYVRKIEKSHERG